jgi:hypothetical protein
MFLDMPVLPKDLPCLIGATITFVIPFLDLQSNLSSPIEHDLPHVPHKDESVFRLSLTDKVVACTVVVVFPIAPITGVDGQGAVDAIQNQDE